ncbi:MAG TPA: hypothetical protein VFJ94_02515 [Intrasporangium sp.]|uniref:hypothetical protein n=1 Tax=Intrasporangium sp. TaxID=1925024 RepID=UPI002D79C0AB|nr:hypothetical protein [Intrasporangium sp.]HET7397371.1 hypothetical protein [Intrasporangium sp.]
MIEFVQEMRSRVSHALDDLARARAEGDEFRVQVHTGELENFAHLAHEHGVRLVELDPYRAA